MTRSDGDVRLGSGIQVLAALCIVVIGIGALGFLWATRLPFMEGPDEAAHADYMFLLFSDRGALVRARGGHRAWNAHPYTRLLADKANFSAVRYNPDGRVPRDYGSPAFYGAVDRAVPAEAISANGALPYVMFSYPFGFYYVDAIAARIGWWVSGGSLVATFFGARFFCVFCSCATVVLSYFLAAKYTRSRWERVAMASVIGSMPLCVWVTSYIQPDALALPLVTACIVVATRAKRGARLSNALVLGFLLGALCLVKPHIAATEAVVIIVWILGAGSGVRDAVLRVAIAVSPSVVALMWGLMYSKSGAGVVTLSDYITLPARQAFARGLGAGLTYVFLNIERFLGYFFLPGAGMEMFWHRFSWTGTPIVYGNQTITKYLMETIAFLTLAIVFLMVVRQASVWRRLVVVFRRRSRSRAVRMLTSDLVVNSYFGWLFTLLALAVYSDGTFTSAGRYWIAFFVPSMFVPMAIVWRFGEPRLRVAMRRVSIAALAAFTIVSIPFGLQSIDRRFYGPSPGAESRYEWLAYEEHVAQGHRAYEIRDGTNGGVSLRLGVAFEIRGWVADSHEARPVESVSLLVDGRPARSRITRFSRDDIARRWNEPAFRNSGFRMAVAGIDRPGVHVLRLAVREHDGRTYLSPQGLIVKLE